MTHGILPLATFLSLVRAPDNVSLVIDPVGYRKVGEG